MLAHRRPAGLAFATYKCKSERNQLKHPKKTTLKDISTNQECVDTTGGELEGDFHLKSHKSACRKTKEGGFGVLRHFQQLRSYRDQMETWNWEDIPFSLQIDPTGLSVGEGP